MIKRLRMPHSEDTLRELYGKPYDSTQWDEHDNRVKWTIDRLTTFLIMHPEITTAVDLSCGDGRILQSLHGPATKTFADVAHAPHLTLQGDIYEMIEKTRGDLLICSETLEHLDDPVLLLERAMERFTWICLTTPLGEEDPEKNYEHYWGWDLWGIAGLLEGTGWCTQWVDTFNQPYYTYQLWIARSKWA